MNVPDIVQKSTKTIELNIRMKMKILALDTHYIRTTLLVLKTLFLRKKNALEESTPKLYWNSDNSPWITMKSNAV